MKKLHKFIEKLIFGAIGVVVILLAVFANVIFIILATHFPLLFIGVIPLLLIIDLVLFRIALEAYFDE